MEDKVKFELLVVREIIGKLEDKIKNMAPGYEKTLEHTYLYGYKYTEKALTTILED